MTDALQVLAARGDLQTFGDNAVLLFVLELATGAEDITSVAASSLTDTSNDKSCDLLWVDQSLGRAVIAQGYFAKKLKPAAPSDKAARLHQAVGWILGRKSKGIPEQLLSAAEELWVALDNGEVQSLEIWYCHNCPESENVRAEISSTVNAANALIAQHWPNIEVDVSGKEYGTSELQELFDSTQLDIAVQDKIVLQIPGSFEERGDDWEAVVTTLSAQDLRDLYSRYGKNLFSLNVRDYLGRFKSDKNINHNMHNSVVTEPARFFAYNNGLTILTTGWNVAKRKVKGSYQLEIQGLAVVNGAQTTGVIGNLTEDESKGVGEARVLTRIVKSTNRDVLERIVQFNNSQNQVEPSDFRSNDDLQDRLRSEFESIPEADYRGGRRGGSSDVIVRPSNLISTKTAAQSLACFHGDPTAAYHEIAKIWSDNDYYLRTFDPQVTARHLLFCFSLLKAIEQYKLTLASAGQLTGNQQKILDYLRLRGGGFMLATAIAANLEELCQLTAPSSWGFQFKKNYSPALATAAWLTVVPSLAEFSEVLREALVPNFRSAQRRDAALKQYSGILGAILKMKPDVYASFAAEVECVS